MKIVFCHNYYWYRGGEDVSFESDVELLRRKGHEVVLFTRNNHDLRDSHKIGNAVRVLWNRRTYREMLQVLKAERPDLLHCNNLFPQISVSVYQAARQAGVPVVQGLRNYRSFCVNSFFYRDSKPCTQCLGSVTAWRGVLHKCYRDSYSASAVVSSMQLWHRILRIQQRSVSAFFTPTSFARQIHLQGGFSPESILVRSNFVEPDLGFSHQQRSAAIFVGRLSQEKGISTIVQAWQQAAIQLPLWIVGKGPEESSLRTLANGNPMIQFLGQLDQQSVLERLGSARFLIMSSQWYETFGRTMAEAFSRGTPVIATKLGTMPELVRENYNGFLYRPGDASDLARLVLQFQSLPDDQEHLLRVAARETFQTHFHSEMSYLQLLKVYRLAFQCPDKRSELNRLIEQTTHRLAPSGHLPLDSPESLSNHEQW